MKFPRPRPAGAAGAVAAEDAEDGAGAVSRTRELTGVASTVVTVIAVAYSGYFLYTAQFGIQSPQAHRGLYWGFAGLLVFLLYPLRRRTTAREGEGIPIWDAVLGAATFGLALYFILEFPAIVSRGGRLTTLEVFLGIAAVLVSLEMTRRVMGWFLALLGLGAVFYTFYGRSMPGLLGHAGYDYERLLSTAYTSFNGIFGSVADIFATYVFIFIIFGAVLRRSGAGRFFVDLPLAVAGTRRGGPAKVAVAVSALMGSVNGSPVANVMTTGNITIPLMRKVGYKREFAGGVEAASSVGGQLLPPVMGAGAFLIAEFTQTPYSTIVLVSIVPALLYFWAVYLLVDFESAKRDIAAIPRSELPEVGETLKRGWLLALPLVLLFTLVVLQFSPAFAGFWATVAALVLGFLVPYGGDRMTVRDVATALREGAIASLTVGAIVGTIGIVIGVINLTGLGLRFSDLVVQASLGSLLLALILTTIVSWVIGLGLTVTSSYIVVAVLVAPALTDLGLSVLVAHLFIFWVSQDANVTPPFALAAFASSSISGGSPMRTAYQSWLLARGLYIVPFLMAYSALIDGPWQEAAPVVITATVGIYSLCAGMAGWLRVRTNPLERTLLLVSGLALIYPSMWAALGGVVLLAAVLLLQRGRTGPGGSATASSASSSSSAAPEGA